MSAQQTQEICLIPKVVEFEYHPEQQMHTTLTLVNLKDMVVSYKIKTNKPGLYLVKPMEGQIFNKDSIKVSFKRKQLSKELYQTLAINPAASKQKFLVELSCIAKDAIGREKQIQQIAYLGVQFSAAKKKAVIVKSIKKQKISEGESAAILENCKKQLQQLIVEKQHLYGSKVETKTTLGLEDLILLMVLAFMFGFIV